MKLLSNFQLYVLALQSQHFLECGDTYGLLEEVQSHRPVYTQAVEGHVIYEIGADKPSKKQKTTTLEQKRYLQGGFSNRDRLWVELLLRLKTDRQCGGQIKQDLKQIRLKAKRFWPLRTLPFK